MKALNDHVVRTLPIVTSPRMTTPTRITATIGVPVDSRTVATLDGRSPRRPIANATRESPRTRLSSTPSIAVTAAIATTQRIHAVSSIVAATSSGAAVAFVTAARPSVPSRPIATTATSR